MNRPLRVLVVHPGPSWSVADVHRGWVRGLKANGVVAAEFDTGLRLTFYDSVHVLDDDGEWKKPYDNVDIARIVANQLHGACYQFLPDVVLVISARFVPSFTYDICRRNGARVVVVHTESPYEDDMQMLIAGDVDLNLINDPTHIHEWRRHGPTIYQPHAYDPQVHRPLATPLEVLDFAWVGTAGDTFPSRTAFLESVDWTGVDVGLAGQWSGTPDDSPAKRHILAGMGECVTNDQTTRLYQLSATTANVYRAEANSDDLRGGWAMGPRELEAAATGCFLIRHSPEHHGGEGDEVLPMLPRFTDPAELGDIVRHYKAHPHVRRDLARQARAAIADRTFESHAAQLLRRLEQLPVAA